MTLSFTPETWAVYLDQNPTIPPGLNIYAAYGEPGDYLAGFVE